ncbi:hypothetical protein FT663_01906 [Candidozyma haemuli var. vulneris]|nr:hypothetical protein FT662_02023 [[Candida] haemuloni var. vulneris]KAF3993402.1 hypothetical protein FT663_01906 [[Candida] haemuloni var. vulneris]
MVLASFQPYSNAYYIANKEELPGNPMSLVDNKAPVKTPPPSAPSNTRHFQSRNPRSAQNALSKTPLPSEALRPPAVLCGVSVGNINKSQLLESYPSESKSEGEVDSNSKSGCPPILTPILLLWIDSQQRYNKASAPSFSNGRTSSGYTFNELSGKTSKK